MPDAAGTTSPVSNPLPPEVVALLDPTVPLPLDVKFFEQRFDLGDMLIRILLAIGFALLAVILIPFGVYVLMPQRWESYHSHISYWPLGFGLLLALSSWALLASVWTSYRLRCRQDRGECTRRGTYLTPSLLVQASESDTTVIPRADIRKVGDQRVRYVRDGADKAILLSDCWMSTTLEHVQDAITAWAGIHPAG